MEQPGSPERALAQAAPYLARLAAVYAALSGLVWLAEVAGWLWTRRWPPADGTDALAVLIYLSRDPDHPALAWPRPTSSCSARTGARRGERAAA